MEDEKVRGPEARGGGRMFYCSAEKKTYKETGFPIHHLEAVETICLATVEK